MDVVVVFRSASVTVDIAVLLVSVVILLAPSVPAATVPIALPAVAEACCPATEDLFAITVLSSEWLPVLLKDAFFSAAAFCTMSSPADALSGSRCGRPVAFSFLTLSSLRVTDSSYTVLEAVEARALAVTVVKRVAVTVVVVAFETVVVEVVFETVVDEVVLVFETVVVEVVFETVVDEVVLVVVVEVAVVAVIVAVVTVVVAGLQCSSSDQSPQLLYPLQKPLVKMHMPFMHLKLTMSVSFKPSVT